VVAVLSSLAVAAVADEQPVSDPSQLTPEQIYFRSVRAMKDAPQPAFVTFRENVSGRNFTLRCTDDGMSLSLHHGDTSATYDVWFRTSDGDAISQPVGIAGAKACPFALLVPTGDAISSMGIPQASPSPGAAPTAAPQSSQMGPPIIGAVRVDASRYYHIELSGIEHMNGADVYHLKLTAYRDPDTHPLTDLFIDRATFLVREARGEVSGHYVIASGRVAGVVDFDRVGNYWLVEHEHFEIAANALLIHARMIATIDGSNFATPAELPGIVFPTPQPTTTPKPRPTSKR
jgi:hypothetical protein